MCTIGNFAQLAFLILIGPCPWINLSLSVWMARLLGGLDGFAAACLMVATFSLGYNDAIQAGFQDDIKTSMIVSGNHFDSNPPKIHHKLSCAITVNVVA